MVLATAVSAMLGAWGCAAMEEPGTAESLLGMKDATNSPVAVRVALKSCSVAEGILLRVEIENQSAEPYKLGVCPAMKLCCVKGLDPMVSYGEKGMSLRDLCTSRKPTEHEAFLPSGAAFAFNMRLAPDTLPSEAVGAGKVINVFLRYELGEQRFIHSNVVKTELR